MNKSPVEIVDGSKIDQALEMMQSALKLLDEVECDSTALMYLDQAIAVLKDEARTSL